MGLVSELRRRNVIRVATAYAVAAWLLIEITATTFPILKLPDWSVTLVTVLVLIGFPLALIFAWAFELTPEGLKKEKDVDRSESITHITGRKLDFMIIGMLVVALGYFAFDKFVLDPSRDAELVQTTTEAVTEQSIESGKSGIRDNSIAVLPFVNMSPDPEQEYFSDGISEETLNLLAKVPELRVTSRSSAFSFKGQNVDIPTIAARLNVAYVLEGSVRKSGNQLRITAQLIEVTTDTHLWSETYDRELKGVFAIQDEIAAAVVDALKITLLGNEPKATETDPEAYALYLQGRHFLHIGTAESNQRAEALLKQALAINSGFAPAWTELSYVYFRQAHTTELRSIDEGSELARHAIEMALAIDPLYARAYAYLAMIELFYDWDFVKALQHQQQALALDPGDATILMVAGRLNDIFGRFDEAIDLFRQSIAIDPVSPVGYWRLASTLYRAHRLDEAADSIQMAMSLNPGGTWGEQHTLGKVLLAQGDAQAALVAMEQEPHDGVRLLGIAVVRHTLGDTGASDAALEELIDEHAEGSAYQIAMAYAFRGEIDQAFYWLEQAYDNRDGGLTSILITGWLSNLHDDPRWEPFIDKMGLPH
jgi:TolB-like protein